MIDIKNFRLDRKLKQSELADMLNFNSSYLSHIENGRREMPKDLYNKFIDTFGLEVTSQYLKEDAVVKKIPFFDKDSIAKLRTFNNLIDNIPKYELEVPSLGDVDFAIPNFDNAMADKINENDIIALKRIHLNDILYGYTYLIVTDIFKTLRYIKKTDNPESLLLVAENKQYDDTIIHKDTINDIFILKGRICSL
jgi:transcriptional regulator with XRE-family HTH domain